MSFVERPYQDLVRDVLTTLTGGVTAETHQVDYDPAKRPLAIPDIRLKRRPVQRVSSVRGFVAGAPDGPPLPTFFSLGDYELLPSGDDPADAAVIRFRPLGPRKPAPGTSVTVNYYPRTTDPTPLTDVNVGSVTRTIVEAMCRELAALYAQLNIAYDSAFIETATGASLDRVVALLSYSRFLSGHAVGSVTFTRRTGASGSITIPAGTAVTDSADTVRYVTSERYDMLAGESVAEVRVQGALRSTPAVAARTLTVVQRPIAGLDSVVNERPTAGAASDESDEALRARARDALLAANKGTVEAIRHGLLGVNGVNGVAIVEMPNGVAGEISLSVELADAPAGADLPPRVLERIEELRPAGIRVVTSAAPLVELAAQLSLVLAGSTLPPAEVEAIHAAARKSMVEEVRRIPVGERVRVKPLIATLLGDKRIVDASLSIGARGSLPEAGTDYQPAAGTGTSLAEANVAFAPDSFAASRPSDQGVRVEVSALIGAVPVGTATADALRTELLARLTGFVATLRAGSTIEAASLLQALRNDALYAIDPLRTVITLSTSEQFVQVAQGGQSFPVKDDQSFIVTSVDLAP
jgi:Baseplate J-like protein